jgi:hypothetical protein
MIDAAVTGENTGTVQSLGSHLDSVGVEDCEPLSCGFSDVLELLSFQNITIIISDTLIFIPLTNLGTPGGSDKCSVAVKFVESFPLRSGQVLERGAERGYIII